MTQSATEVVRCIAPTGDWCGEGVLWHPDEQAVYWTDINRFLIHRWDAHYGSVKSWFFDEPVTAVLLTERSEVLVVVLGSGAFLWEPEPDTRHPPFWGLPGWPAVRCNDAGIDLGGALWVGSMRNNVNADGSPGEAGGTDGVLYRIRSDGQVREWISGITISNTIAWTPDAKHFYTADTMRNRIDVYECIRGSDLGAGKSFLNDFNRGLPDGSTVDNEGYLWNSRHGGACIVRVAPNAEVNRIVEIPTVNVTNCTFGGTDLKTLFVTTAALGAGPGDRLGGSLFAIQSDCTGQPENRFRQ